MERVNILGTTYKVYRKVSYKKDKDLKGRYGYCDDSERKIVIGDLSEIEEWKKETADALKRHESLTLRHEVIHAFLSESGLRASSNDVAMWAKNEEMIDWFACQYPKMKMVFEKLHCEV